MVFTTHTDRAYFSQFERGINTKDFCVNNGFHYDMYNRGLLSKMLITFNKQPQISFNTVDISDMKYKDNSLDNSVAYFSAMDLGMDGLNLQSSSINRISSQLISSYLLNGSLCYVEEKRNTGIERYFATKSPGVYKAFFPLIAPKERKKGVDSFNEQFINSYQELETGIFKVVKLFPDIDGFRISKHRINTNKNGLIIPRYAVVNFANTIASYLQSHKVKLVFTENGVKEKIYTTLDLGVVSKLLGTSSEAAQKVILEEWTNPLSFGRISIPDLSKLNEFVSVPLFNINSVEAYA